MLLINLIMEQSVFAKQITQNHTRPDKEQIVSYLAVPTEKLT